MSHETGLSKKRVELLTDGIFAVVMTLLVLDIGVLQISYLNMLSIVVQLELNYLMDYLIYGQNYSVLGLVL